MTKPVQKRKSAQPEVAPGYSGFAGGISELLEASRRASARTVNALMTATYWEIGNGAFAASRHQGDFRNTVSENPDIVRNIQ